MILAATVLGMKTLGLDMYPIGFVRFSVPCSQIYKNLPAPSIKREIKYEQFIPVRCILDSELLHRVKHSPLAAHELHPEDIFIAHISAMDAMAHALLNAAAVLEESPLQAMVRERYASFDDGLGKKFEEGKATLEELYDYAKKSGEPTVASGKQELYETLLNLYAK